MNPETDQPYYDDDPVDYSDPSRQILWVAIAVLFLVHAIPAVAVACKALTIDPRRISPIEHAIFLTLGIEAICSIIGFVQFLRKQRWGWILTAATVVARTIYLTLAIGFYNESLTAITYLALLFSALILILLFRPPLRELFSITPALAWRTVAISSGVTILGFVLAQHNVEAAMSHY